MQKLLTYERQQLLKVVLRAERSVATHRGLSGKARRLTAQLSSAQSEATAIEAHLAAATDAKTASTRQLAERASSRSQFAEPARGASSRSQLAELRERLAMAKATPVTGDADVGRPAGAGEGTRLPPLGGQGFATAAAGAAGPWAAGRPAMGVATPPGSQVVMRPATLPPAREGRMAPATAAAGRRLALGAGRRPLPS